MRVRRRQREILPMPITMPASMPTSKHTLTRIISDPIIAFLGFDWG